jgi:hypothetical protein
MTGFDQSDRVDQWFLARWTKLTASENYKLMAKGAGSLFSPGGYTYIKQKAMECCTEMWERPELEEVKSLLHGKMYELPAYQRMVQTIGIPNMLYLGTENPLFLDYEELKGESGGTPDSIAMDDDAKVQVVAEIKCPKNPMNHFDRLKWKDQWDVKEKYFSCYSQIQNLLLITGAPLGFFVSYDERIKHPPKKIKIIEVKPDRKFQDELDVRLRMAVKEKYKMLDEYMNN